MMEECPSLDPLRHSHTQPLCAEDLWDRPGPSLALIKSASLLDQNCQGATQQHVTTRLGVSLNIYLSTFLQIEKHSMVLLSTDSKILHATTSLGVGLNRRAVESSPQLEHAAERRPRTLSSCCKIKVLDFSK